MAKPLRARITEAIRGESLDGWLFYNFRHRDALSDGILGIEPGASNTRPWAYAVSASGEAVKIVHTIEAGILDGLEGKTVVYADRESFFRAFRPFAGKTWGAHVSEELPIVSFLDSGTAAALERTGLRLVPAAALVQRLKGLLDAEGMASHERAATGLYEIVSEVWEEVDRAYRSASPVSEASVRRLILEGMEKRGLETDHPPIVAAGRGSGDPHYDFTGEGAAFRPGDIVQLDLWAKEKRPGAIYADISWVGVYAEECGAEELRVWETVRAAREEALRFVADGLGAGVGPSGADVDRRVRSFIEDSGLAAGIRHRTGHGIDTECHGSGVNLDCAEFPDGRRILEGSCFSIEPGLYFERFGMRTEIDVYIRDGSALVSGAGPQRELLRCGRSLH